MGKITIETNDTEVLNSLGLVSCEAGETIFRDGTMAIEVEAFRRFRSEELGILINLVVSFGSGVGSSMVAAWLFNRLQGKSVKLRINGLLVEAKEKDIARALNKSRDPKTS